MESLSESNIGRQIDADLSEPSQTSKEGCFDSNGEIISNANDPCEREINLYARCRETNAQMEATDIIEQQKFETLSDRSLRGQKLKFECLTCGRICSNRGAFQTHVKSHKCEQNNCCSQDMQHKCSVCGKNFEDGKSLQRHYCTRKDNCVSKQTAGYGCPVCEQSFKIKAYLFRHMKESHPAGKLHRSQTRSDRLKHFADDISGNTCNVENKRSTSRVISPLPPNVSHKLRKQETETETLQEFICEETKNVGSEKELSLCHEALSSEKEKSNTFETSRKVFPNEKALVGHIKIDSGEKYSQICDKRLSRQDPLLQHKTMFHQEFSTLHVDAQERNECYRCFTCNKKFKLKSCFDKHMENHSEEKSNKFECNVCGKWFDEAVYLRQHMIVHSKDKPYKCKICRKSFKYNVSYCRHMLSHPGENEQIHLCSICNKTFAKPYLLKSHMIIHSKNRPFKCLTCSKTFYTRFSLRQHIGSHLGEKPFQCDVCGQAFRQKATVDRHRLQHSGTQPHTCSVCGKMFKMKCEMTKHKKLHGRRGKIGGNKPCRKTINKQENNKNCVMCRICNKVLGSPKSLAGHMQIHALGKFHCDFCHKSFSKIYVLKSHLRVIHNQILVNPKKGLEGEVIKLDISNKMLFKCPVCGLVFIHQNELSTHIRIHTGQKPYECSVCGEMFNERASYEQHMSIHQTVNRKKSHACALCSKQFGSFSEVQRHMVCHTGERPYKCVYCGQAFGRKGNLKEHILRKHPLEEICFGESC